MRFFRWLISNVLTIVVIIGVIYSYMYWGNLVGSETPAGKAIVYLSDEFAEVRHFVDGIKEKNQSTSTSNTDQVASASTQTEPVQSAQVELVTEQKPEKSVEVANGDVAELNVVADKGIANKELANKELSNKELQVIEEQPATISYSHNNQRVEQDTDGNVTSHEIELKSEKALPDDKNQLQEGVTLVTSEETAPKDSVVLIKKELELADTQKDGFVSPQLEQELENATANGGVAALTSESVKSVWIEARKSFYKRDYAQSENSYMRVIALTKNNFDAYGELGNVYFHQGKNDEATEAYMKAAAILIEEGQVERANSLLGLMRFLNKDKAQQLKQTMESTQ